MLNQFLKTYLFRKHVFVGKNENPGTPFETIFALAEIFRIRITKGAQYADTYMIRMAEKEIGITVPEPFYRGFPTSVRKLSKEQLLYDQLYHYFLTYGLGYFSEPGHSIFEEAEKRNAFTEKTDITDFVIVTESEAEKMILADFNALLAGTRPLNDTQYELVKTVIDLWHPTVGQCANKDTAVRLLLETRDLQYLHFLKLSDVYTVTDQLNYISYENKNVRKLNLKNKDRKFLSSVIDHYFENGRPNIAECYEKKAFWQGLLHHIHYKPVNEKAQEFVKGIRGKGNLSAYAEFERYMADNKIEEAVDCLLKRKGSGDLLRHLFYILSRCTGPEQVDYVLDHIETGNAVILLQLLRMISTQKERGPRIFMFTKYNLLRMHTETEDEFVRSQSSVSKKILEQVDAAVRANLAALLKGRLGKVYVDPAMKDMALPLQEATAMGGYGVLPTGSRIPLPEGKKIRAFTYWEKVNDIDLSVIGLDENKNVTEFSWRTMRNHQSTGITFSGDETSGYRGGSEYFDVDIEEFTKIYPDIRYLVFCDNVFSGFPFDKCLCTAGYMMRDIEDSGKIFEPKTVKTSYAITGRTTFAYLYALDLQERVIIWLNVVRESEDIVAAETDFSAVFRMIEQSGVLNIYDTMVMMAEQVVDDPAEAEVIVSDTIGEIPEGAHVLRSTDTAKIIALINGKTDIFEEPKPQETITETTGTAE